MTDPDQLPVVLSLGMGVDSVAILTRWLTEPGTRDFDLGRLVVLTAMTGEEYPATERLMTRHVLPMMRAYRVRYVQIARAAQSSTAGYTVLDDSRSPAAMHMRGPWRLSDELRASATVPQVAHGRRLCSIRAKGEPLDAWIAEHIGGDYIHVIGFSADEQRRIDRDTSYTRNARQPRYPLAEWGWDRARSLDYLHEIHGVAWQRSCCTFCPFALANPGELAARWHRNPAAAGHALNLEYTALAANPRSALFGRTTAHDFPPYPATEHLLVLAPAGATDKQRPGFDGLWTTLTGDAGEEERIAEELPAQQILR